MPAAGDLDGARSNSFQIKKRRIFSPPRPDVLVAVCLSSRCSRFAFYSAPKVMHVTHLTGHAPLSCTPLYTDVPHTHPARFTEPERCLRVRTQVPVSPTASTASETGHPSPLLPTDRAIARNGCPAAQTDTLPANQRTLFLLCHKRYHTTHATAQASQSSSRGGRTQTPRCTLTCLWRACCRPCRPCGF